MPKKRLDVAFLSLPTPYYTQKHPHASKVMMHKFLETLTFISSVSLDTILSQYIVGHTCQHKKFNNYSRIKELLRINLVIYTT